jgi:hypothetical protein
MEVTYQLTADDLRHGNTAWLEGCASGQRSYWFNFWTSLAAWLLLAVGGITLALSPHSQFKQVLWAMCAASALWFASVFIRSRSSIRAQFHGMPSAQDPITLTVSETGIHFRSLHSDSQSKWSMYIGWAEEDSVFVLFPQPKLYLTIPKRAFTGQQQVEFRETLRRNILPLKGRPSHD